MPKPSAPALARALRRAISRVHRSFRESRDVDAPTPSELSALGTLHRHGALATGALAERERLRPQSLTRLVASLADAGLVERTVDENDRRRVIVAITRDGIRRLAREMERREARLARAIAERTTPQEREALGHAVELLERLAEEPAEEA